MTEAHPDLISIPLAAARTGLPVDAFAAEALRRHDEIPVYVQPDPPGWRAVLHQADPRSRVPEFEETFPDDVYDVMLTDRILLTPDVLREVLATGKLHRVTIDGETVGTAREEVGYTAWSIGAKGQADYQSTSAVSRHYQECFLLCEAQRVPLEALLVPRSALDLLGLAEDTRPPSPAEEIRDLLRPFLSSDPNVKKLTGPGRVPSARAQLRAELGRDAVISVTEAAERLPWGDGETQWMIDAEITFRRGSYRYVVWGDVLDALPARDKPKKSPRRRTRKKGAAAGGGLVKASDLPRF